MATLDPERTLIKAAGDFTRAFYKYGPASSVTQRAHCKLEDVRRAYHAHAHSEAVHSIAFIVALINRSMA